MHSSNENIMCLITKNQLPNDYLLDCDWSIRPIVHPSIAIDAHSHTHTHNVESNSVCEIDSISFLGQMQVSRVFHISKIVIAVYNCWIIRICMARIMHLSLSLSSLSCHTLSNSDGASHWRNTRITYSFHANVHVNFSN